MLSVVGRATRVLPRASLELSVQFGIHGTVRLLQVLLLKIDRF
jgi:hypothetical protein